MGKIVTKSKRVQKTSEEREQDILLAASQVFAMRGFQTADMQTIADAASVGKGTIYRYFESKERLFKAVLKWHIDSLVKCLGEARDQHKEPLHKLRASWISYIKFFQDNQDLIELLNQKRAYFRKVGSNGADFLDLEVNRKEWLKLYEQILSEYPHRNFTAEQLLEISGQLIHGAVLLSNVCDAKRDTEAHVDTMMEIFTYGFLKPEDQTN